MPTFAQKQNQAQQKTSRSLPRSNRLAPAIGQKEHPLLHLQRMIGNQATRRLLQARAQRVEVGSDNEVGATNEVRSETLSTTRFGHDFSVIPVHTPAPITIQPKLSVNTPGDVYEQEADHIAEQVMRMPEPKLQRACACGGGCSRCQTEQPSHEHARLQTKHVGPSDTGQVAAPPIVHEVLASPGQALDASTRAFMEPRFGQDFSQVRVHSDAAAAQSARDVNAKAYTVGHNVVVGANQLAPGTQEGRRLLAHELTHVVQQAGAGPTLQREPKPDVRAETKSPKASPKDSDPKLSPFVQTDLVRELKRDNETWTLTIDGFHKPESVKRVIWPYFVPPGITIDLKVAILDPIERGWFVLNGVTFETVRFMEPSFAKLFSDHGLEDEPKESEALRNARTAFLKRHDEHSDAVLLNIVVALDKITKRNPELLIAYYEYYAHNNLRDETKWNDRISSKDYDPDRNAGATAYGGTIINPRVLDKTSKFPTDNKTSLLAGTLIHEFVHTPHGGGDNAVSTAAKEAKAYGIEVFFSERMGDKKRAATIDNISWNSTVDVKADAKKIFNQSYGTIKALYQVIDQGGPVAKKAREMSVEFISKNSVDYGPELKAFIAKIP